MSVVSLFSSWRNSCLLFKWSNLKVIIALTANTLRIILRALTGGSWLAFLITLFFLTTSLVFSNPINHEIAGVISTLFFTFMVLCLARASVDRKDSKNLLDKMLRFFPLSCLITALIGLFLIGLHFVILRIPFDLPLIVADEILSLHTRLLYGVSQLFLLDSAWSKTALIRIPSNTLRLIIRHYPVWLGVMFLNEILTQVIPLIGKVFAPVSAPYAFAISRFLAGGAWCVYAALIATLYTKYVYEDIKHYFLA